MGTFVNPRPQPVRVFLSDGSHRTVGPWGLVFVPDALRLQGAEYAEGYDAEQADKLRPTADRRRITPRRAA